MRTPRGGLPKPAVGRVGVLDELKGVAILVIVLSNVGAVLAWRNLPQGQVGVDLLVILGAIGLALGAAAGGTGPFLLRQLGRVYPAYWVVLAAFLAADAHFLGWHFSGKDILLHSLGIHALFGPVYEMSINHSFWFVTLIVCLAFLFAPLRKLTGRPGWILDIGVMLSLALALACLFWIRAAGFEHLALRLPGFFIGLLIGHRLKTGKLGLSVAAVMAGAFFLLVCVPYAGGSPFDSAAFALAIIAAYAFGVSPVLPGAARSCLTFLGDRWLEIFLIHRPLIGDYNRLVHARLFPGVPETRGALGVGLAVAVAVTILLSHGLHSLLARLPLPGNARAHGALRKKTG
jgi:peptidoglycan/LPS O-acetylase OafA/YrhL